MRLDLPSIGIEAVVKQVGTQDRVLEIPERPTEAGWWRDGVGPGEGRGTVVLTAHLDSRKYGTGPFVRTTRLREGDPMTLTDAEGTRHTYEVSRVTTYRKTALPYEKLFDQRSSERVVFVTCGGSFDPSSGWDSNVVVTFRKA